MSSFGARETVLLGRARICAACHISKFVDMASSTATASVAHSAATPLALRSTERNITTTNSSASNDSSLLSRKLMAAQAELNATRAAVEKLGGGVAALNKSNDVSCWCSS